MKFSEETLKDTLHFCTVVICGSEDISAILKELVDKEIIKNNICGKLWKEGGNISILLHFLIFQDTAYKCSDCEVESSWYVFRILFISYNPSAICIDCFNNGNHVGHNCMDI